MLHIILLILKIIGWILLAILGLIVLLICVTLFVPFRYRVDGSCKGTLDSLYGRLRFSWLCHLISGFAVYEHGRLDWRIRIAWKKLSAEEEETDSAEAEEFPYKKEDAAKAEIQHTERSRSVLEKEISEKEVPDKEVPEKEVTVVKKSAADSGGIPDDELLEKLIAEDMKPDEEALQSENKQIQNEQIQNEQIQNEQIQNEQIQNEQIQSKQIWNEKTQNEQTQNKQTHEDKAGVFSKIQRLYEKTIQKIQALYNKIEYTFHKICDTIKTLFEKKEKLEAFITDEVHKSAMAAVIAEVKRMLRFLKPRRVQADVHYGFEDPCITGQVLAVLSVIYPLIGEHANIEPDFEQKILEGEVMISGKIRALYAIIIGWNLIWNKNVRITFKHVRNFKL